MKHLAKMSGVSIQLGEPDGLVHWCWMPPRLAAEWLLDAQGTAVSVRLSCEDRGLLIGKMLGGDRSDVTCLTCIRDMMEKTDTAEEE